MSDAAVPVTDWCTAFPDDWSGVSIAPCCERHDHAYEVGAPKLEADQQLGACAYDLTADPLAYLILAGGTLLFGLPRYLASAWRRWRSRRSGS